LRSQYKERLEELKIRDEDLLTRYNNTAENNKFKKKLRILVDFRKQIKSIELEQFKEKLQE
jgi:hypothetical protein